jgi:hypothetical protein
MVYNTLTATFDDPPVMLARKCGHETPQRFTEGSEAAIAYARMVSERVCRRCVRRGISNGREKLHADG